jgi:hypothetical protein
MCPFVVNRSCIHKGFGAPTSINLEDSNLAWSVEAMPWVLLYVSIGQDVCYCEHVSQHG